MKFFSVMVMGLSLALVIGCSKSTSNDPIKVSQRSVQGGDPNPDGVYPHNNDWINKLNHGLTYAKWSPEFRQACINCHMSATATGPSCYSCHDGIPHAPEWKNHDNHGKTFLAASADDKAKCQSCHSSQGSISGVTCTTCHAAYPHTPEFIAGSGPAGHKAFIKQSEMDGTKPGCASCHAGVFEDLPQYHQQISCYKSGCHPIDDKK